MTPRPTHTDDGRTDSSTTATSRPRRWTFSAPPVFRPAPPSDQVGIPDDPGQVYDELILESDLVCQHCGRRLRRRVEFPEHDVGYRNREVLAFVEEVLPDEQRHAWIPRESDVLGREYFEQVEVADRVVDANSPDRLAGEGGSTACWHCGSEDTHSQPATRSVDEALRYAAGVSVSLQEFGVVHDWFRLLAAVDRLKQVPATAGDDDETLRRAVEYAIEAVQKGRS